MFIPRLRIGWQVLVALSLASFAAAPAQAADPMKVGVSLALTGGVAVNGKQILMALEFWRDDVNAKGGLLGRPVELVYYDDQSNPSTVPALYTKLITVDKVDLLLGPYATNMVAPAMPVIMQNNKTTISFLAIGINQHFNYPKYFSMVPVGPKGPGAFSDGFFELAAAQSPKPQTVAIVSADAEFAKTAADAARDNAKALGFNVAYERSYPPPTTDFLPVMRAVQAANADIVYVAAYPPDTVGVIRAANEINLVPKMFGGAMIGLLVTPIKVQLGPLATVSSSAKALCARRRSNSPASPICSTATRPKRPAKASIRSATASCRSAMRRGRCSLRRWKQPRTPMMTSSPPTSTPTRSRQSSGTLHSAWTVSGLNRGNSSRNFRTSPRTISSNSVPAPNR